jgi:hypothetical protein
MKRICFIVLLFCGVTAKAQWVGIPDTNFGAWLKFEYPTCMQGNSQLGWQMDTTCSSILNENSFFIYNIPVKKIYGLQYFKSLDTLRLELTKIDSINIQLASTIRIMSIYGDDSFKYIAALPVSLVNFNLSTTSLQYLPGIPNNVEFLYLHSNKIISIPTLPATLKTLTAIDKSLTGLPSLPPFLESLNIMTDTFSVLPPLPNTLRNFFCSFLNKITLPSPLPDSLRFLDCHQTNLINGMPPLPSFLNTLYCQSTGISSLPPLPDSLILLACDHNILDSLPALPKKMRTLLARGNRLSSIPALPDSLRYLEIGENMQLTSIPDLPPYLIRLWLSVDTNITCLPLLPKSLSELDLYQTKVSCLPNRPRAHYQTLYSPVPNPDSLSLCNIFNDNGCSFFSHVSGRCFLDENSDCIYNTPDIDAILKIHGDFNGMQQITYSYDGTYGFIAPLGPYTVTIDTTYLPFIVCPSLSYSGNLTPADSTDYNQSFAIECKPGFDLAAFSIVAGFRVFTIRRADIHVGGSSSFYGINCSQGISGKVTTQITGPVTYISPAQGALTPDSVNGNELIYIVPDFGNTDFNNSFNIMLLPDTSAQPGDTVCITVTVTPISGDEVPTNNILTQCFVIRGSFDPNDKQVYPISDIDINGEKWLTYTVRFQNTGNDTAIHIYIADTLDSDLDVSTFQLLAYSHLPQVQIRENEVQFNFPNINLPDSFVNEPLSHGYVQYKVKIKDGKPLGTTIHNTAYIYFDFNAPVITNTTTNTITSVSAVRDNVIAHGINIFPNPNNGVLFLNANHLTEGEQKLYIKDYLGREVLNKKLKSINGMINTIIDLAELNNGLYSIYLHNSLQTFSSKIILIKK